MPNTAVTPARIKVWIIEVVVLTLVLVALVWWLSTALSTERKDRRDGEVILFTSSCERINKLTQGARDSVDDALARAGLMVDGKPTTPEAQEYRKQQFQRFEVRDCSRIPKILQDGASATTTTGAP